MKNIEPGTRVRITSEGPHAVTGMVGIIHGERYGSSYPVLFPGWDSEPDWYNWEDFEIVDDSVPLS